jgi:hypothetical protein
MCYAREFSVLLSYATWSRDLTPSTQGTRPPPPCLATGNSVCLQLSTRMDLESVVANCEQPNLEYVALSWAVSRTLPFFKTNYSEKYCCVECVHTDVKNTNLGEDRVQNHGKNSEKCGNDTGKKSAKLVCWVRHSLPARRAKTRPSIPPFFF